MKTMFAIMISLLASSCGLLQEISTDQCSRHTCDGMEQLTLVQKRRLVERTGVPWHVWADGKTSVSMALMLKQKYQLSNAQFSDERNCEP